MRKLRLRSLKTMGSEVAWRETYSPSAEVFQCFHTLSSLTSLLNLSHTPLWQRILPWIPCSYNLTSVYYHYILIFCFRSHSFYIPTYTAKLSSSHWLRPTLFSFLWNMWHFLGNSHEDNVLFFQNICHGVYCVYVQ